MILTNRLFHRAPPNKNAKSIYIFCEGAKRELNYFYYFKEMDSRINIEIYKLHPHENNSPSGLLKIAKKCILKSDENPYPKYDFIEGDELWFVLDIDKDKNKSREPQILDLQEKCTKYDNWNIALSNPCFEVWLYYHIHSEKPFIENSEKCSEWKKHVNNSIEGGFDSRKHPIYIEKACKNSIINYTEENGIPKIGSSNVNILGKSIIPLISLKLKKALKEI